MSPTLIDRRSIYLRSTKQKVLIAKLKFDKRSFVESSSSESLFHQICNITKILLVLLVHVFIKILSRSQIPYNCYYMCTTFNRLQEQKWIHTFSGLQDALPMSNLIWQRDCDSIPIAVTFSFHFKAFYVIMILGMVLGMTYKLKCAEWDSCGSVRFLFKKV